MCIEMDFVELAVNGTLMRGLELEKNLLNVNAKFVREAKTKKCYRLWSIRDKNPAMIRISPADPQAVQVLLLAVMAYQITGNLLHEWMGYGFGRETVSVIR